MKLAISNIAWTREEEAQAAELMTALKTARVEIAPTKAWDDPLAATAADITTYRQWWADRGIEIVALQSLNFGKPHFQIFNSPTLRAEMLTYLQAVTILGARLGAKVMVFGSPRNRLVGDLPRDEAMDIAVPFFTALGRTAADHGVSFCIEPNPTDYGCDFVTNTREGIELVRAINHPGFGLHLDAAGLTLAGDDPAQAIPAAMPHLQHFHLSAPFLEEVGPGRVDHALISKTLRAEGYSRIISIEMKPGEPGTNLPRTRRAIEFIQTTYVKG